MVRSGEAMVIDVRPSAEYEAGHIEGAVNIPLESLAERLSKLPKEQEIVAYCRGPYCMMSFDAVRKPSCASMAIVHADWKTVILNEHGAASGQTVSREAILV